MPSSPSISSKLRSLDTDQLASGLAKANKRAGRQRRLAIALFGVALALVFASIWTNYHVQLALTSVLVFVVAVIKVVNTVLHLAMASACRQALAARGESDA